MYFVACGSLERNTACLSKWLMRFNTMVNKDVGRRMIGRGKTGSLRWILFPFASLEQWSHTGGHQQIKSHDLQNLPRRPSISGSQGSAGMLLSIVCDKTDREKFHRICCGSPKTLIVSVCFWMHRKKLFQKVWVVPDVEWCDWSKNL